MKAKIAAAMLWIVAAAAGASTSQPASGPSPDSSKVFVIQGDGSMTARLQLAQTVISAEIERMPNGTAFDIVFDGKDEKVFSQKLVEMSDQARDDAGKFLASISAGDRSRDDLGLMVALKLHPKAVWFLSNGNFAGDKKTGVGAEISAAKRLKIPINSVFIGADLLDRSHDAVPRELWDLSAATGGRCILSDGTPAKDPHPKPNPRPARPGPGIFGD